VPVNSTLGCHSVGFSPTTTQEVILEKDSTDKITYAPFILLDTGKNFARCHDYFFPFFVISSILMGGLVFEEYHKETEYMAAILISVGDIKIGKFAGNNRGVHCLFLLQKFQLLRKNMELKGFLR
jgi:hypothetical protein